jgi:hypothetical protein
MVSKKTASKQGKKVQKEVTKPAAGCEEPTTAYLLGTTCDSSTVCRD